MADAPQDRIDAIRHYLQGKPASAICRALGRTRYWLYKWLKRYDPANPAWAHDQPRAPRRVASKTPEDVERLVCEIRQRLVTTKYAQRGALAIQWQLEQLGVAPLPEVWTINRILKRHRLVGQPTYQPRGTPYPTLPAPGPQIVHQLDLVGPRYLTGGQRFYGVHVMDAHSNAVALAAMPSKRALDVVDALVAAWQKLGIPRYLQVDNELSFRGSNRQPRSFGLLLRLCLYLGVAVLFIPEREPWRNGIVERFNDVYDKLFWRPQQFRDLAHLREELLHFETFQNTQHRYAKLGQQPPWAVHTTMPRRRLAPRFALHRRRLPWREGRVLFVRLTDAQGYVRFYSETFRVDPALVHEYVRGTIFTKPGLLKFTHHGRVVHVCPYTVTKPQGEC
jgi:putative transposase